MRSKKLISCAAALSIAASSFAGLTMQASAAEPVTYLWDFTDSSWFNAKIEKNTEIKTNKGDGEGIFFTQDAPIAADSSGAKINSKAAQALKFVIPEGDSAVLTLTLHGSKVGNYSITDGTNIVTTKEIQKTATDISASLTCGGTYYLDTTANNVFIDKAVLNMNGAVTPVTDPTTDPGSGETQTTAPTTEAATPKPTVDPNATSEIKITREAGWLESAYITWTNPVAVDGYNVYVRPEGGEYTKIDKELTRFYGSYYRADALGLAAGKYQMKVAAVLGGVEKNEVESGIMTVRPYIREGFAFDPQSSHLNRDGIGAYKMDGTLKDGAKVLYITDANKNTVTFDVVEDTGKNKVTTCTGLGEILATREKNNAETTPLAIRMIGQVEAPADVNGSKYMQIKSTSNITFEGVGDDATTYHWSLLIRDTNNIEVRNIAVMEFYDDGISLDTDNFNDWIHNCDIFYGQNRGGDQKKGDGSLDVKSGSDYCTFSYNHFWDSGKCSLCGMKEDSYKGYRMTYYGNWFDHSDSRHPRVRGDQVHIYNNYYDGNSKYGAGACTGGSLFVEKNVFRNCAHPVLTSMQGTDMSDGKGTFSGEDGGSIKMFDNEIFGGYPVKYSTKDSISNDTDAYRAVERMETVPENYTAKQGGAKYSNFDTALTMYSYSPLDKSEVVNAVQLYAGRVQGGDFTHEFNDSVDDALYDRDEVLGNALQSYKTSLKTEYKTGSDYPATEGTQPEAKPTIEPFDPSVQPTTKPGGGGSSTPSESVSVIWRASDNASSIAAGTALKDSWLTLVGNGVEYKASNKSIGGVNLTGNVHGPSGQTAPTLAENGQNGATLKFTPDKNGTIGVYYKLNNGKIFYITDESGTTIASHENTTGSSEYTYISAAVEANKTYYAFGDGTNSEYWAADYSYEGAYDDSGEDDPIPTTAPATTAPATTAPATTAPATTAPAQVTDSWTASAADSGKKAGSELMRGLTMLFDDTRAKGDYISGAANFDLTEATGTALKYVAPADGVLTVSVAKLGTAASAEKEAQTKTLLIIPEGGSESNPLAFVEATGEPATVSANVTEGTTYYIYAKGSKASFASASFAAAPAPAEPTVSPKPCVKITASYKDGRLVGVKSEPATTADASLSDDETKIFFWESLGSMKPVEVVAPAETTAPAFTAAPVATAAPTSPTDTAAPVVTTEPAVTTAPAETTAPAAPTTPPAGNEEPTITVGTGVTWSANDFEQGAYTADIVKDGLTIGASDEVDENDSTKYLGHVVIDSALSSSGKPTTINGVDYTNRIKTGGAGDTATGVRCFSFVPDEACDIELVAASSSSSATRTIEVLQNGAVASSLSVKDKAVYSVSGLAAKSRVYIYSTEGGLNVYALTVKQAGGASSGGEAQPTTAPDGEYTGVVAVGNGVTWLASDIPAGSYTSTFSLNGLNIGASADKNVSVEANNKTFDGVKYTSRIKPNGKGDPATKVRTLYFTPDSDCTMTVNALTAAGSTSTEKDRTYVVKHGDAAETFTVNDNPVSQTVSLKANEEVIIYPDVSAVNFYSIILSK